MDKLIELLPLYAELQGHPKLEIVKHYARACVAHATAAKDAEIEALRAEVETWKNFARGNKGLLQESVYRAERLAEALREAADMLLADYPETAKRLRDTLHPTAAQEGKNDDV